MRFVVDTVGRPLSEFRSTKELAIAIWDAIKCHQLIMERGGILHRNVSSGNILIVEQPQEHPPSRGILHDYDYSSMTLDPPGTVPQQVTSEPPLLRPLELADDFENIVNCKEQTGTYHFIAIELLNPLVKEAVHDSRHDLESFFWVLLWIVLRHTNHEHEDGKRACARTFLYGHDGCATDAKKAWLSRIDDSEVVLPITGNSPLTALLSAFHSLVYDSASRKKSERVPLTYDAVLAAFDNAIEREDWPVRDDATIPYFLIETRTLRTVFQAQIKLDEENCEIGKHPLEDDEGIQSGSEIDSEGSATLCSSASAMASKRRKITPAMLPRSGSGMIHDSGCVDIAPPWFAFLESLPDPQGERARDRIRRQGDSEERVISG